MCLSIVEGCECVFIRFGWFSHRKRSEMSFLYVGKEEKGRATVKKAGVLIICFSSWRVGLMVKKREKGSIERQLFADSDVGRR